MQKLLRLKVGAAEGSSDGLATDSALDRATLTTKDTTKSLVAALHADNVVPLVTYRIIRTMLNSESILGWQYLAGGKPALDLFKKFSGCVSELEVIAAFKRHMCVDSEGNVQMAWYSKLDKNGKCPLPMKLVKGTFAANGALEFNPWVDIVGPMVKLLSRPVHFG